MNSVMCNCKHQLQLQESLAIATFLYIIQGAPKNVSQLQLHIVNVLNCMWECNLEYNVYNFWDSLYVYIDTNILICNCNCYLQLQLVMATCNCNLQWQLCNCQNAIDTVLQGNSRIKTDKSFQSFFFLNSGTTGAEAMESERRRSLIFHCSVTTARSSHQGWGESESGLGLESSPLTILLGKRKNRLQTCRSRFRVGIVRLIW